MVQWPDLNVTDASIQRNGDSTILLFGLSVPADLVGVKAYIKSDQNDNFVNKGVFGLFENIRISRSEVCISPLSQSDNISFIIQIPFSRGLLQRSQCWNYKFVLAQRCPFPCKISS